MVEVTEQEAREACSNWTLEAMQHLVSRGRDIKVAMVIAWAMQEFARRDAAAKSRDAFEMAGLHNLLRDAEPGTFMHRQLVDRIESKKREISMGCTEQDARDAAARLADGDYPIGKDGIIAQIQDEGTVHAWATRIMGYECPPSTPLTREWFHENGNDVSMICVFGDNCEYQFEAAAGEPSIGIDVTTVVGGGAMHIATLPTVRTVGQLCALMAALLRPVRNSAQYIPEDDGGENTAHILRRDAERAERATPITSEWLESIGFESIGVYFFLEKLSTRIALESVPNVGWNVFLNGLVHGYAFTTRGQLIDVVNSLKGGVT